MTNTEIIDRIRQLKKEKNAVILAHYYTRPEVQDIADYLGDSLGLSQEAGNGCPDYRFLRCAFYGGDRSDHFSGQKDPDSGFRSRMFTG